VIQAQIYRELGVAIVKGRAECLLALLECTVLNASPRSKVACGKSRDKLIERANVAQCSVPCPCVAAQTSAGRTLSSAYRTWDDQSW